MFYREVVTGPAGRGWIAGALLALAVGFAGVALVLRSGSALGITLGVLVTLFALVTLVTAVSFRALSVQVDRDGVAFRFGPLFRRRFSLDEVQMFRGRNFAFRTVGGWGIGRAHDGVDVYRVWGASGTALDLVVKRAGVTRHYLVSSVAPDLLCAAIVRANDGAGRK